VHVSARPAATAATAAAAVIAAAMATAACQDGGVADRCGATEAEVARVLDGDTIELAGGERVRYLMVDAPEVTTGAAECYGSNAATFNADLVLGKRVELRHDAECRDAFGRTLAYVRVADQEVNTLLVERGYACMLHVPPNGADRAAELEALQEEARLARRGLWGACAPAPCD
jgi:micrococcal nuclease